MTSLSGQRLLVVGASSGIGRAFGLEAARRGADVAFAGRREALLREPARDAGGGAVALACDVRDPAACERMVAAAADALGGLDGLVYAAAVLPLGWLARTGAETWQAVLETNVVGAALVTRAALPHLTASCGRALFLSSDGVARPRPGLVPYLASKAALDTLVAGWRAEAPEVAFTRVVVGPTLTGISAGWDAALASEMFARWEAEGHGPFDAVMSPDDVAVVLADVLGSPVRIPDITLQPRPAS